jgi:hypothetical protein
MTTPHPSAVRYDRMPDSNFITRDGSVVCACSDGETETILAALNQTTGVGELVAALEEAKFVLEFPVNARTSEALAKINQALARHQQRSQPKP